MPKKTKNKGRSRPEKKPPGLFPYISVSDLREDRVFPEPFGVKKKSRTNLQDYTSVALDYSAMQARGPSSGSSTPARKPPRAPFIPNTNPRPQRPSPASQRQSLRQGFGFGPRHGSKSGGSSAYLKPIAFVKAQLPSTVGSAEENQRAEGHRGGEPQAETKHHALPKSDVSGAEGDASEAERSQSILRASRPLSHEEVSRVGDACERGASQGPVQETLSREASREPSSSGELCRGGVSQASSQGAISQDEYTSGVVVTDEYTSGVLVSDASGAELADDVLFDSASLGDVDSQRVSRDTSRTRAAPHPSELPALARLRSRPRSEPTVSDVDLQAAGDTTPAEKDIELQFQDLTLQDDDSLFVIDDFSKPSRKIDKKRHYVGEIVYTPGEQDVLDSSGDEYDDAVLAASSAVLRPNGIRLVQDVVYGDMKGVSGETPHQTQGETQQQAQTQTQQMPRSESGSFIGFVTDSDAESEAGDHTPWNGRVQILSNNPDKHRMEKHRKKQRASKKKKRQEARMAKVEGPTAEVTVAVDDYEDEGEESVYSRVLSSARSSVRPHMLSGADSGASSSVLPSHSVSRSSSCAPSHTHPPPSAFKSELTVDDLEMAGLELDHVELGGLVPQTGYTKPSQDGKVLSQLTDDSKRGDPRPEEVNIAALYDDFDLVGLDIEPETLQPRVDDSDVEFGEGLPSKRQMKAEVRSRSKPKGKLNRSQKKQLRKQAKLEEMQARKKDREILKRQTLGNLAREDDRVDEKYAALFDTSVSAVDDYVANIMASEAHGEEESAEDIVFDVQGGGGLSVASISLESTSGAAAKGKGKGTKKSIAQKMKQQPPAPKTPSLEENNRQLNKLFFGDVGTRTSGGFSGPNDANQKSLADLEIEADMADDTPQFTRFVTGTLHESEESDQLLSDNNGGDLDELETDGLISDNDAGEANQLLSDNSDETDSLAGSDDVLEMDIALGETDALVDLEMDRIRRPNAEKKYSVHTEAPSSDIEGRLLAGETIRFQQMGLHQAEASDDDDYYEDEEYEDDDYNVLLAQLDDPNLSNRQRRAVSNMITQAYDDDAPMRVKEPVYEGEFADVLNAQWSKDRAKKAERKRLRQREREIANQLHELGGRKGSKKAAKAGSNIVIDGEDADNNVSHFHDRMRRFVTVDVDQSILELPAMSKKSRIAVHLLSEMYGLKHKSYGKGNARFPILEKTGRTTSKVDLARVNIILHTAHGEKVNPREFRSNGRMGKMFSALSGDVRPHGAGGDRTRQKEGAVVGQGASKLDEKNVGYNMLKKMGWTEGQHIGVSGEGISDPVIARIKTNKSGLGSGYSVSREEAKQFVDAHANF